MNIIKLDDFINFINLAKFVKADVIYYKPINNTIYSGDYNLSHIKYMELDKDINIKHEILVEFNKAVTFIKELQKSNIEYINVCRNRLSDPTNYFNYLEFPPMKVQFSEAIKTTSNFIIIPGPLFQYDLSNDEDFLKCISAKASEGLQMFKKDNFIMCLFSGILPINKSDTVTLYIRDVDRYSFIAKFVIKKKKCNNINIYIRYMKLLPT